MKNWEKDSNNKKYILRHRELAERAVTLDCFPTFPHNTGIIAFVDEQYAEVPPTEPRAPTPEPIKIILSLSDRVEQESG